MRERSQSQRIFNAFTSVQTVLLLTVVLLLSAIPAQQSAAQTERDRPELRYSLKQQHPINVRKIYKMTQDAVVRRTYKDSSFIDYQRTIEYYLTTRVIEQNDGFTTVTVLIDSMRYVFANLTDSMQTTYNSQTDKLNNEFDDLTYATIPNSRIWNITYSSYGDIVKVESEDMNWVREYIKPLKNKMTPMQYAMWDWASRDENMIWLGDIDRNVLPEARIKPTDTWQQDVHMRVSNMDFTSPANFNVVSFQDSVFTIQGKADSLQFKEAPIETYLPMNSDLSQLVSANGTATYHLEMQRFGTVQFVDVNARIHAYIRDVASSYHEDITLRNTIELLGMFKW